MNRRHYQYEGLIGISEGGCRKIILDDLQDDRKPPIAIEISCAALAEYLNGRGWTDREERYIKQTWIYDGNLFLEAVVIPSTHEYIPAKVIACADPDKLSDQMIVFGPAELIDTPAPDPMSREEYTDWLNFRAEHGLRPLN